MPTLTWIGKDKVVTHHKDVPYRVLTHKYGFNSANPEDKSETHSGNKIIHGDNLEALKSLLPEYEGKVQCVYIDPPYNTGKENWVYNDNVNDPKIQKWLGDVFGKEGEDLSRHDKWLCMMYPRLTLLKSLLKNTGAIFISIDDNEYSNLKSICDEIFGRQNYVKTFIWYTKGHTDNQDVITHVHEYILMYAKSIKDLIINQVVDPNIRDDSKILRNFAENSITKNGDKNPPSVFTIPSGFPCEVESLDKSRSENIDAFLGDVGDGYISRELTKKYKMQYPARIDDLVVQNFKVVHPCRVFSGWMNLNKLKKFSETCEPYTDIDGSVLKYFLSKNGVIYYRREGRACSYIQSILENMGTTETNKYLLEKMGVKFDFPKPYELIKYLISLIAGEDDVILDSFAGSGTTAHATLELNKNSGNRKFILIEINDYAESGTSSRVKAVMSGYDNTPALGGAFDFYELGERMFDDNGDLNENIDEDKIREYIFFTETKQHLSRVKNNNGYWMDDWNDTSYYFYYKRGSATTLSFDTLMKIVDHKAEQYIIYADICTISDADLAKRHIIFKKIPRDITRF